MANSVDPDQMPHSVASELGLNCLLRPVCPNIFGYYGNPILLPVGMFKTSGVRSAMHAASRLPGWGPTDVDVAPVPAH